MKLHHGEEFELAYGPAFGTEDLHLVELEEGILQEMLRNGVDIKGEPDEEAVLCTSSKTYAVKFVGSSNTMFIMAENHPAESTGADGTVKVTGARAMIDFAAPGYLELVETAPRLDTLKVLLRRNLYDQNSEAEELEREKIEAGALDGDDDAQPQSDQGLYSFADLLANVQASECELREALESMNAAEVNGKWRLVDEKYMRTLLDVILCTAVEHDWPLSALPEEPLVTAMHSDGYSKHMVRHCLKTCARPAEEGLPCESEPAEDRSGGGTDMDVDAGGTPAGSGRPQRVWALHSETVCLHRARQLLAATGSKWRLEDFMDAWAQDLPVGMTPERGLLRGEALEEKVGGEVWLRPFSAALLPARPAERFDVLFQQKPRWQWEELEPYLKGLKTPGQSIEALLLKFTRKSQPTPDQPAVYSRR